MPSASSNVSYLLIVTTGPKISSRQTRISGRTLARSVGSKNGPSPFPREDLGALGDRLVHPLGEPVDLLALDHGPDVDRRVEWIADLELDLLHQARREVLVDLGRHQHALDADAALARLVVAAERHALRREVEVGIGVTPALPSSSVTRFFGSRPSGTSRSPRSR